MFHLYLNYLRIPKIHLYLMNLRYQTFLRFLRFPRFLRFR
jgi:hypothetical protein